MTRTEIEPIANAIAKVRRVFAARPQVARADDAPATATMTGGLRCEMVHPSGYRVHTDMPSALAGGDTSPPPGWYLRAAIAACASTLITMRAAELGIALDELSVTVRSQSDKRGMLGMDDVGAGCDDLRMEVRLAAEGVSPAALREVVEWSYAHAPVSSTIACAPTCQLTVDAGG
jgi:uncharacterized OsmC-like protein